MFLDRMKEAATYAAAFSSLKKENGEAPLPES